MISLIFQTFVINLTMGDLKVHLDKTFLCYIQTFYIIYADYVLLQSMVSLCIIYMMCKTNNFNLIYI